MAVPAAAAEAVATGIACVAPAPGWVWVGASAGGLRNVCRPDAGYAPADCAPVCCVWDGWWLGPEPTRDCVRDAGRITGRDAADCGCCGWEFHALCCCAAWEGWDA